MKFTCTIFLFILVASCASSTPFPKERYFAFIYYFNRDYRNDTVQYHLKNPLLCPITIRLAEDSENSMLSEMFGNKVLNPLQGTLIKIHYPGFKEENRSRYVVQYGDSDRKVVKNELALPYKEGKKFKVIQGYNGRFSHESRFSQFALDFDLQPGDTITSADDGFVVGVIEDYLGYGTSKKWRNNDRSNHITLYHPHSGLYTQYVHLKHKGSLVSLGDTVLRGQPIGISGMTGFTNTPHLHFNVKVPSENNGLESTDIIFENGVSGKNLKKGDMVIRLNNTSNTQLK